MQKKPLLRRAAPRKIAASARALCLAMLQRWREGSEFADKILAVELHRAVALAPSDRAFAQELFYGVLRNRTLLDFWLGELRREPIDDVARDFLRLGLYQILFLETAPHAAVFETVELAPRKIRGLVNALLRRALREQAGLTNIAQVQPPVVQFSHPEFLFEKWRRQFGAAAMLELCRWNNQPAPVYARQHGEFVRLTDLPAALTGDFYIQDPSTALAAELLDPQPNERVLDACAAPGGKASLLAERMGGRGTLIAADRDEQRLRRLRENFARLKIENAEIVCVDWLKDAPPFPEKSFDKILLDAPCSNTGVMRRRVDVRWRLQPNDFVCMPAQQLALLEKIAPLLRSGGSLVYSTCSLEPEENEAVVRQFLDRRADFRLTNTKTSQPWRDGFDGAFAACLQRVPAVE